MKNKFIHSILSFFTNAELEKQLEMRRQMSYSAKKSRVNESSVE